MTRIIRIQNGNNCAMKISLSVILNTAISVVLTFLIALAIISLLKTPIFFKISFAILFSASIGILVFLRGRKKHNEKQNEISTRKNLLKAVDIVNFLNKDTVDKIFNALFLKLNLTAKRQNDFYCVEETSVYPCLYIEDLTCNDLKKISNDNPFKVTKTIVISKGFTENALTLAKNLSIICIPTKDFIPILVKYNLLPHVSEVKIEKENFFKRLFKRVNGTKFIVYGVCLVIFSFFVFYPIYYRISGVIFLTFGTLAVLFDKKEKQVKTTLDFIELLTENKSLE